MPRPEPTDDHLCRTVEEIDDGYVLVCTCGWRSAPAPRAAVVGELWDEHRTA